MFQALGHRLSLSNIWCPVHWPKAGKNATSAAGVLTRGSVVVPHGAVFCQPGVTDMLLIGAISEVEIAVDFIWKKAGVELEAALPPGLGNRQSP